MGIQPVCDFGTLIELKRLYLKNDYFYILKHSLKLQKGTEKANCLAWASLVI